MVWIYGGGFTIGGTSMSLYDGMNLAKKGVILVSVAYRLGAFGFMAHPELTAEQGGHSGNYGLLGPDRRIAVGEAQHRRVRWRSEPRHDFRRIGGRNLS